MTKRKETKWVLLALILLLVSGCIPELDNEINELLRVREQLEDVNEAAKGLNPYYIPTALVLTILGEAGAIWKVSLNKIKAEAKRQADKAGRELALRQIAAMPEDQITAPVVKEKMYSAIALTRSRMGVS